MQDFRKNIWSHLQNQEFREAFFAEHAKTKFSFQLRAMRKSRGWTQNDLARKLKTTQNVISRIENIEYGKVSLKTLLELAAAFDVCLSVEFVSHKEGLKRTNDMSQKRLNVKSFAHP